MRDGTPGDSFFRLHDPDARILLASHPKLVQRNHALCFQDAIGYRNLNKTNLIKSAKDSGQRGSHRLLGKPG
jgi:hypothetical protein